MRQWICDNRKLIEPTGTTQRVVSGEKGSMRQWICENRKLIEPTGTARHLVSASRQPDLPARNPRSNSHTTKNLRGNSSRLCVLLSVSRKKKCLCNYLSVF